MSIARSNQRNNAMEKIHEKDIAQAFIGKPYNLERYSEIFNKANIFYCGHCDVRVKMKFGITPALYIGWEQRGIDLKIHVSVSDGTISHCSIIKYKDNYRGIYTRTPAQELKPTQQELRVFKRVMEYVTI